MEGGEIVQAYIVYPTGIKLPLKELHQFKRMNINKNSSQMITMKIPVNTLQKWDSEISGMKLYSGEYTLILGGSSDNPRLLTKFNID